MPTQYEIYRWGNTSFGALVDYVVYYTFAPTDYTDDYSSYGQELSADYQAAVHEAFETWEAYGEVDFVYTTDVDQADILIGWSSMDGAGGTVSDSEVLTVGAPFSDFYSAYGGYVFFDPAENWTLGSSGAGATGISFNAVALHEIGHIIGLAHNPDPTSIMYADYGTSFDLSDEDKTGMFRQYGGGAITSGTWVYGDTIDLGNWNYGWHAEGSGWIHGWHFESGWEYGWRMYSQGWEFGRYYVVGWEYGWAQYGSWDYGWYYDWGGAGTGWTFGWGERPGQGGYQGYEDVSWSVPAVVPTGWAYGDTRDVGGWNYGWHTSGTWYYGWHQESGWDHGWFATATGWDYGHYFFLGWELGWTQYGSWDYGWYYDWGGEGIGWAYGWYAGRSGGVIG